MSYIGFWSGEGRFTKNIVIVFSYLCVIIKNTMRILVTGGVGFIGHHLINKLRSLGHTCLALDNTKGCSSTLLKERIEVIDSPLCNITLGSDPLELNEYFSIHAPDAIIHLAGPSRQQQVDQDSSNDIIAGTLSLLQMARKYKIHRFVYISSSMVYGNFIGSITEDAPTNPLNTYGVLKLKSETIVKHYCKLFGITYNIIRPCSVYGVRDNLDRVVNKFFTAALHNKPLVINGKKETLDFTYVDDLTDGIILATLAKEHYNEIYNISRSQSRYLTDAADLIIKLVGQGSILIKDSEYTRGALDINKAMTKLGYVPKINIEEGFKKCYGWIKNTIG